MGLDSLSSPHRRAQNTFSLASSSRKYRDELGSSWSALLERHRFLLTMLVALLFLCTVYLYFAITLGATHSCAGMSGAEKAVCEAKSSVSLLHRGKLKFF